MHTKAQLSLTAFTQQPKVGFIFSVHHENEIEANYPKWKKKVKFTLYLQWRCREGMKVQHHSSLTLVLAPLPPMRENPASIYQEVRASVPHQV